ncbi:retrotransposon protein, putative, ty1-copia subclass [Tanacetum coccineum]
MNKLQRDEVLQLTHDESLKKCKSYIFRKMVCKSFPHQVERAKDLLGLIHTDVCGPFRTVLREGASYFITFTDDFSRYGYVYLMKHKHEGCEAPVKQDTPDKLDPRSIKFIFVGYSKETMGYYFYYPLKNKIFVAQNDEFFKNNLMVQEASRSHGPLKSKLEDLDEPPNYKAALSDPKSHKWLEAMNTEMQSMKDNQVWVLVELPPNGRIVVS